MNPLDGKGQADKNVVAFRYVLIESDTLPKEEQERFYRKYELPIACLVDSAGKSVHAGGTHRRAQRTGVPEARPTTCSAS